MYSKGSINTSSEALYKARNQSTVVPEDIEHVEIYKKEKRRAKYEGLSHLYQNDYKPAVYRKAVEYRDSMSYKKKLSNGSYVTHYLLRKKFKPLNQQTNSKPSGLVPISLLNTRGGSLGYFLSSLFWRLSEYTSTISRLAWNNTLKLSVPISSNPPLVIVYWLSQLQRNINRTSDWGQPLHYADCPMCDLRHLLPLLSVLEKTLLRLHAGVRLRSWIYQTWKILCIGVRFWRDKKSEVRGVRIVFFFLRPCLWGQPGSLVWWQAKILWRIGLTLGIN